jgi:hypothetical protein
MLIRYSVMPPFAARGQQSTENGQIEAKDDREGGIGATGPTDWVDHSLS